MGGNRLQEAGPPRMDGQTHTVTAAMQLITKVLQIAEKQYSFYPKERSLP